jgi:hypothetical protein
MTSGDVGGQIRYLELIGIGPRITMGLPRDAEDIRLVS